ncbi:hypothetical protein C8R45DRAFT_923934 [Mycena sanguinolenta]|nr:hypothetical protein C8R45DRAFT_923934 [Mycena sanguinolenta]
MLPQIVCSEGLDVLWDASGPFARPQVLDKAEGTSWIAEKCDYPLTPPCDILDQTDDSSPVAALYLWTLQTDLKENSDCELYGGKIKVGIQGTLLYSISLNLNLNLRFSFLRATTQCTFVFGYTIRIRNAAEQTSQSVERRVRPFAEPEPELGVQFSPVRRARKGEGARRRGTEAESGLRAVDVNAGDGVRCRWMYGMWAGSFWRRIESTAAHSARVRGAIPCVPGFQHALRGAGGCGGACSVHAWFPGVDEKMVVEVNPSCSSTPRYVQKGWVVAQLPRQEGVLFGRIDWECAGRVAWLVRCTNRRIITLRVLQGNPP